MAKIKGPGVFLAQFLRDEEPYNNIRSIGKWAAGLGYKGVQIPGWDPRTIDLDKAAESKTYCDEYRGMLAEIGLDDVALERFRDVVGTLFSGASAGHFPANPGESGYKSNCTWCDFDTLCPSSRHAEWRRVADAEPLRAYADLAEGDDYTRPDDDRADDETGGDGS